MSRELPTGLPTEPARADPSASTNTGAPAPLPVRGFLLRFALLFAVLEAAVLLVFYRESWFEPYAAVNAHVAAWLLGPFLEGARATGGVLVSPTYTVSVRPGCDAYQALVVLLSGVVAFPAPRGRKWVGVAVGSAVLLALNPPRLAALLWTGAHRPESFDLMHLSLLPALYVAAALGLWLCWALWARRR